MKFLISAVVLAAAPVSAFASPYSIELGAGVVRPAAALDVTNTPVVPNPIFYTAAVDGKQAAKATFSPYISVARDGPAHLRFRDLSAF